MTRRILITGGAGFIGSHAADAFLAHGWAVEILDDLSTGKLANVPARATFHRVDVRSLAAAQLVRGGDFDAIVHLAAQMDVRRSVADPLFDLDVNVRGTVALLETVRHLPKRPRVVFASTGGVVYGDQARPPNAETATKEPDSPYAVGEARGRALSGVLRSHSRHRSAQPSFRKCVWASPGPAWRSRSRRDLLLALARRRAVDRLWRWSADARLRLCDRRRRCDRQGGAGSVGLRAADRCARVQHRDGYWHVSAASRDVVATRVRHRVAS